MCSTNYTTNLAFNIILVVNGYVACIKYIIYRTFMHPANYTTYNIITIINSSSIICFFNSTA